MRKAPRRNLACQNPKCKHYNKKNKCNIIKKGFRGKVRNYKCTFCERQFVETYGTPLYHKKMKKKEIIRICELFTVRLSFRGVARATHHKLDTIRNLAEDMANHARQTNEFFLHDLKLNPTEVDEIWTFVKKNKKILPKNFARSVRMEAITHISH